MTDSESNCGACTSAEVQALFCELLDSTTSDARAREIRRHLSQCHQCQERLEREEFVRSMVSKCCGSAKAPQSLRRSISVSITKISFS